MLAGMRKLYWILLAQLLVVAVQGQNIYLPLFSFQAFYYQDNLEIAPGANLTITGPVAANSDIYLDAQGALTFLSSIAASGGIYETESPADPTERIPGSVTFAVPPVTNEAPYLLPCNPFRTNAYAMLMLPPAGNGGLYEYADMIVIISNNGAIYVSSGEFVNRQATVISNNQWQVFLSTNGAFYDQRDNLTVNPLVLDVSNFVSWNSTNTVLAPVLPDFLGVESIYLADLRSTSNSVIITNYSYYTNFSTNSTTTVLFPAAGAYVPPVTTNTATSTTSSYPPAGSYTGTVTTNTTSTNTVLHPSPGTYVGNIITNRGDPTTYTYNAITGYTYDGITDYTYLAITGAVYTNTILTTNWTVTSQPGIVLSNGAVLPPGGLSIVTPDPAYIVGNWNIRTNSSPSTPSDAGLSDTRYTRPSAIFADAITVLSPAWNPANSSLAIGSRQAANDTVNAAFFAGDVPSDYFDYSGGLENFPRQLENWSGFTFTWNGSMCCMFSSQIANAPWPGTGTVYNAPIRNWAFDTNFANWVTVPVLTPSILTAPPNLNVAAQGPSTLCLSWITSPGVYYTIQSTTNLLQGPWSSIGSLTGAGGYTNVLEPLTETPYFYRLQVWPY